MNSFTTVVPLVLLATSFAQEPAAIDRGERHVALYDLRDLCRVGQNVDQPWDAANLERVAALLREHVQPPMGESDSIHTVAGGTLVVLALPAQQTWIETFLRQQRSHMIEIQAQVFRAPRGAFTALGPESGWTLTTPADCADLQAKVGALERVDTLATPRVLAYPLQRATVSMLDQVAYVKEYHVQVVEPGHQSIADPVIDVIDTGVVITTDCARLAERLHLLSVDFRHTEVKWPIPTKKVRLLVGNTPDGEIGLPEVVRTHFSTTVTLPEAGGVMLVAPGNDGEDLALLITVATIAVPAGETGR